MTRESGQLYKATFAHAREWQGPPVGRSGVDLTPARRLYIVRDVREHPISCEPRLLAQSRGEDAEPCQWIEVTDGYSCARCGLVITPDMARHEGLAEVFDSSRN
jgi:hypothetical protein